MSKTLSRLVFVLVVALSVASCRSANLYTAHQVPLNASEGTTLAQIEDAIKRAGVGLGWEMRSESIGRIEARLPLRSHVAIAQIDYDTKEFSINYKDSVNLDYDPAKDTIHKNYNSWIMNLQKAIQAETIKL